MSQFSAQKTLDKRKKAAAGIDPNVVKGEVPQAVIDELVSAKTAAKDSAGALGDAIKAQAAKYGVKPGALRKYVAACEADKIGEIGRAHV